MPLPPPPHTAKYSPGADCPGSQEAPGLLKIDPTTERQLQQLYFKESMRLKPNDGNAATHLIRSALGERGFQRKGDI